MILQKQSAIGKNARSISVNKKKFIDYHERLMERLKDPEYAIAYLNEAVNDEDQRVFLLALKDVIEANGGDMTELAQDAKLNRPTIYRMLSKKGNPRWDSLTSLFNAIGIQMHFSFRK